MKNLTKKIVTLLAALVFSLTAIAQNKVVYAPYPQYGFWSNWEVGVHASIIEPFKTAAPYAGDKSNVSFGHGLSLYKELDNIWGLNFDGSWNKVQSGAGEYALVSGVVTLSLIDIFDGYDPNRLVNMYLLGGIGFGIDGTGAMNDNYGRFYYEGYGGLGVSVRLNRFVLRIEDDVHMPADLGNGFTNYKGYYNRCRIVLTYHCGITKVDNIRIEQMDIMLDKGEAYDSVVTDLNKAVERKDDTIRDYIRTLADITVLNHKMFDTIEALEKVCIELDSLEAMLDTMRADQYNYWALPVSIQFDFDSYEVKERYKVEALAEVMNDGNEYIVVGFTDNVGTEEYNNELSQKRVDAVYNMLIGFGIPADKMEVRSVGFAEQFGNIDKVNRKVSVYRKL